MRFVQIMSLIIALLTASGRAIANDEVSRGGCIQLGIGAWYEALCDESESVRDQVAHWGDLIDAKYLRSAACQKDSEYGYSSAQTIASTGSTKDACGWAKKQLNIHE